MLSAKQMLAELRRERVQAASRLTYIDQAIESLGRLNGDATKPLVGPRKRKKANSLKQRRAASAGLKRWWKAKKAADKAKKHAAKKPEAQESATNS